MQLISPFMNTLRYDFHTYILKTTIISSGHLMGAISSADMLNSYFCVCVFFFYSNFIFIVIFILYFPVYFLLCYRKELIALDFKFSLQNSSYFNQHCQAKYLLMYCSDSLAIGAE